MEGAVGHVISWVANVHSQIEYQADDISAFSELIEPTIKELPEKERVSTQHMLQASLLALQALWRDDSFRILPEAMTDWRTLATMRANHFATDLTLAGMYSVLVHVLDGTARSSTRQLIPSYFMIEHPNIGNLAQVHIIDGKIGSLRNLHLVSFRQMPTKSQLNEMIRHMLERLGTVSSEIIDTEPFQHEAMRPIFNLDGCVSNQSGNRTLAPLVKTALSRYNKGRVERPMKLAIQNHGREPNTVVIWARQSRDEGSARTSISRQVWAILTSKAPPPMQLHTDDRIVMAIEYCSSAAHPSQDRLIRDMIPTDRPLVIGTTNPDRFTRRGGEALQMIDELRASGGSWFAQGASFDGLRRNDWFDVTTYASSAKAQIDIGRNVATQMGFYTRAVHQMTRSLAAQDGEIDDWQAIALRKFMALAKSVHRIESIVILVRDSETEDEEEEYRLVAESPVRQAQCLRRFFPSDVEVKHLSLKHVSASSDTKVIDPLREVLRACKGRAMLVSTSVDRVTRSTQGWRELQTVFREDNHMAVAFLWDTKTAVDSTEAMLLPSSE